RDHRLREALDELEYLLPALRRLLAADRRLGRELVDVGAGDEGLLAAAGDDHRAHGIVVARRLKRAVDLRQRLRVQRVEDFRAVNGEAKNAVRDGDFDVLVIHVRSLLKVAPASSPAVSQASHLRGVAGTPPIRPPGRRRDYFLSIGTGFPDA